MSDCQCVSHHLEGVDRQALLLNYHFDSLLQVSLWATV